MGRDKLRLIIIGIFAIFTADDLKGLFEGVFLRFDLFVIVFLLGLNLIMKSLLFLVNLLHFICHLDDGVYVVLSPRFLGLDRVLEEFHPRSPAFLPRLELLLLILSLNLSLSLVFSQLDFSNFLLGKMNMFQAPAISTKARVGVVRAGEAVASLLMRVNVLGLVSIQVEEAASLFRNGLQSVQVELTETFLPLSVQSIDCVLLPSK